jgi:hypothetical protein
VPPRPKNRDGRPAITVSPVRDGCGAAPFEAGCRWLQEGGSRAARVWPSRCRRAFEPSGRGSV